MSSIVKPNGGSQGVFDLDPVVKQSEANASLLLGVVGVDDGVHDRLPNRNQRDGRTLLTAHALDDGPALQMFTSKRNGLLRGAGQQGLDLL